MLDNYFHSKYKYIRLLGRGGCGDVYLAENVKLGNLWAVKEIAKGRETTISGYLEPEILKRLNHPALPRICDVYEDECCIYIVEDYIEGISLKRIIKEKGSIEEKKVAEWAVQLCSVLDYLHSQKPDPIIYGDMKPHNIILAKGETIKLIDFGISAVVNISGSKPPGMTETAFIGTKGYAAPEQFMGGYLCPATDIYSLGITLIHIITGVDPIKQYSFYQDNNFSSHLSPEMYQILKKCINLKPEFRYQTAEELMKALRHYLLAGSDSLFYKSLQGISSPYLFSKIIAVTGASGTGVSTLTVAMSEQAAKSGNSVCIVDLSNSVDLAKIIVRDDKGYLENLPVKVKPHMYYVRPSIKLFADSSENVILYKLLGQLQEKYKYIFIDGPPGILNPIERYLDNIFIISDMNPYNISKPFSYLEQDSLMEKIVSRTSFILNKFYKGELGSDLLIYSVLNKSAYVKLKKQISGVEVFEVPYSEKVYLKWMYGYFDKFTGFNCLLSDSFKKSISNIISHKVIPNEKKSLLKRS
ncbi:protein kinase domain-containing protein [Ruminiclostridium cellulolyticum]|uniref:Serine/threonine protein kinase n=1 Tax=Ruminiclostridium cellulolyticum (strain ATCC 35319 / DSM 5812 / JCM 6584 / H10) TaxID=394503 RepID=B8I4E5_RUMCH|nr:protein kinase [Ruminiclostridium cellulolyticum]ACL74499.1 serine/threonine protein kinase [Ruminiclostridium cellulolyticum H10]